ncbi:MAG: hypothetical protein KGQ60_09615, partial [Planctomycetes bacterium]|nr:hypothetical protein [Planctomycetota bacterium]
MFRRHNHDSARKRTAWESLCALRKIAGRAATAHHEIVPKPLSLSIAADTKELALKTLLEGEGVSGRGFRIREDFRVAHGAA